MKTPRKASTQLISVTVFLATTAYASLDASVSSTRFELGAADENCLTEPSTRPARSQKDCGFGCSADMVCRSFSFAGGVCALSTSPSCAGRGATELFWKAAPRLGYTRLLGDRRLWVVQQRRTGSVSFARNWTDYERGFGDENDFWAGLTQLNSFTSNANATLRIELVVMNGSYYFGEWSNFTVRNAASMYMMQYGEFLIRSSNLSCDPLGYNKGMPFSTLDRDNDQLSPESCSANRGNSGFWYSNCGKLSANGMFPASLSYGFLGNQFMYCRCTTSGQDPISLGKMRMMLEAGPSDSNIADMDQLL